MCSGSHRIVRNGATENARLRTSHARDRILQKQLTSAYALLRPAAGPVRSRQNINFKPNWMCRGPPDPVIGLGFLAGLSGVVQEQPNWAAPGIVEVGVCT